MKGSGRTDKHQVRLFKHTSGALVALSLTVLAAPLSAQDLTLVPADDQAATMRLVADRDESSIEADLETARAASEVLEEAVGALRLELAEAKARVDVKDSEIDIIKTKKDLADKEDNEAEKKAFEQQEDDEELQKRLLERHVDLIEREIDYTRAQRETARSSERVFQAELRLESTSRDLKELQSTEQGTLDRAMRLQADVSKLEKDVLDAMRDAARKKEQEAQRERRVIEAQLDVIEARNRIRSS